MRRAIVGLGFVLFGFSASCASDAHPAQRGDQATEPPEKENEPLVDPKPLPPLSVIALDGTKTQLADVIKGKVAVIDLWATWCTSCRPVSARAATLASAHASDPNLIVVGINMGEEAPIVASFVAAKKPPHPIYLDPNLTVTDTLGLKELPAIIIVDRQGRILQMTNDLSAKVVTLIEDELQNQPAPAHS